MPIKKTKMSTIIITLVGGLIFIMVVVILSIATYNRTPKYYNPEKANKGEKIFTELSEMDFVNAYPEMPEEVVEVNNKIMLFLYGNILTDTEKISEVLEFQRNLFSDELNNLNQLESQVENTIESFNKFAEEGIYILDIKSGSIKYTSRDDDTCSVIVTFYFNKVDVLKKQYDLIRDSNNNWKLNRWSDV